MSSPKSFPDCSKDPFARRITIPAAQASNLVIDSLGAGSYAVALIHDENGNGRLDTFAGVPREGFGFSRNPKMGFGPPNFEEARFELRSGQSSQTVRVRYVL